jgi:hypothetical protein
MSDEKKNNTPENETPEKKEHKKKKEYKKEHEIFPDGVKHQHPHLGNNRKIDGRHRHVKASDIRHQWKDISVAHVQDLDTCTVKVYLAGRDRRPEAETEEYYPLRAGSGIQPNWFETPYTVSNVSKSMLLMSFLTDVMEDPASGQPTPPGHITSHVNNLLVSSDTLPPVNNVPDWLRGFTFYTSVFPGTEDGYTNLEYDEDGKLICGDWEGEDPMYIIGKYVNPDTRTQFDGFHGAGYPDERLDQITLGDIVDENGIATFTLTFELDSFHFVVEYDVDENGKKTGKIVFKPRNDQKAWFTNPYGSEDESKNK